MGIRRTDKYLNTYISWGLKNYLLCVSLVIIPTVIRFLGWITLLWRLANDKPISSPMTQDRGCFVEPCCLEKSAKLFFISPSGSKQYKGQSAMECCKVSGKRKRFTRFVKPCCHEKSAKLQVFFYEKDQTLKPVKLFPIFMDVEVQGKVQWGFDLQNVWKKEKRVTRLFFIPPNGSIKRAKCKGVLQNVWRNSRVSDRIFSMGGKILSFIKCNGALQNIWRKKTFLNYMVSDRIIYMDEKGPSFIKPRRLWRTIFWWNI